MDFEGCVPAVERLWTLIDGFRLSQVLFVAVRLGIPDQLSEKPLSLDELASRVGAVPSRLLRLMKVLVVLGIVVNDESGYANSSVGNLLITSGGSSAGKMARYFSRPSTWEAWGCLELGIRSEAVPFQEAHGTDAWTFRAQFPEEGAAFDAAMTPPSSDLPSILAKTVGPVEAGGMVVDVGGGRGALLDAVLSLNPLAKGVLVDRPEVVGGLSLPLVNAGRITLQAKDIRTTVPTHGNVYLLKSVLHDWDDDAAVEILSVIRKALSASAVMYIYERVLDEMNTSKAEAFISDIQMLVVLGGRERSQADFKSLIERAGLELLDVQQTGTSYSKITVKREAAI